MKKILLILAVLSLNGCAVYDAYFMAKYDTNEHALVSKIRTMAELGVDECKKTHFHLVYAFQNIYLNKIKSGMLLLFY